MAAYAGSEGRLDRVLDVSGGETARTHTAKKGLIDFGHEQQVEGEIVELNPHLTQTWIFFQELNSRRVYDKTGPKLLSFRDIHYWSQVVEVRLAGWQIKAILQADSAYLSELRKK